MNPFIRLHPSDDVLIARSQLMGGTSVKSISVKGLIPAGHKIATHAIGVGKPVAPLQPDHRFCQQTRLPRVNMCTHTTCGWVKPKATLRATTPWGPTFKPPHPARGQLPGLPGAATAAWPRAQLHQAGVVVGRLLATAARAIADQFSRQNHPRGAWPITRTSTVWWP